MNKKAQINEKKKKINIQKTKKKKKKKEKSFKSHLEDAQ